MQPCLSNYTIPRAVQLKIIVLYCRRNAMFLVHTSPPRKEHVKIIFIPVIALSFPTFAPNWNRLCTYIKDSIPDMVVVYLFLKGASKYLKMPCLCKSRFRWTMKPKSIWPQSTTIKLRALSVLIWSLPFYYSVLAEHFEGSIKKNIYSRLKCCIGLIKPSKWNTPNWEPNWGRMNNGSLLLWPWRQIKRPIDSTEMSRW